MKDILTAPWMVEMIRTVTNILHILCTSVLGYNKYKESPFRMEMCKSAHKFASTHKARASRFRDALVFRYLTAA